MNQQIAIQQLIVNIGAIPTTAPTRSLDRLIGVMAQISTVFLWLTLHDLGLAHCETSIDIIKHLAKAACA